MKPAPLPAQEAERLRILHELRFGDTETDPALQALARLATVHSGWPIGAVSLVDADRQWFPAAVGLTVVETPRSVAFCAHTILGEGALEVDDARHDERFAGNPLVTGGPHIRAYAARPVIVEGQRIGTVCAIDDRQPNRLDARGLAALADLASLASHLLEARLRAQRSRLQEARVRAASRAGSDWLWESSADGTMTWVSESVEAHAGQAAHTEVGQHAHRVVRRHPRHPSSWDGYLAARAVKAPFKDVIAERDTPRGAISISFSGQPVFDSAGRFRGYRGATRNVTRELALRAQAEQAQALLQGAMEHIPAALMISDPQGRIVLSNKAWRHNTAPFTDGTAETWEALLREMVAHGAYPQAAGREAEFIAWRLGVVERSPHRHEMRFGDLYLLMSDQRLADGSVVHLSVDITARKRDELALAEQGEQLRASEARWKFALDGAGYGVWDHDEDTGAVFFSARWKEMLGLAESEPAAGLREWTRRIHPDDRPKVMEAIACHRRGETETYETQHRLRHQDGRWIWVLDRAKIVERRADGSPRRVVGTHSDITRQKLADQALRDRQASELASRAKSEFLSRMSHEMRTPLNAVIGFAQLLRLHGAGDEQRLGQYSEHILQAAQHLLALVNDVLDLQHVEEGRLSLQFATLPLAEAVEAALDMVRPMAASRSLRIDSAIDPGVTVRADAQRLRQVLLNVLSNAVKYNRDGGHLRCRVQAAGPGRCALLVEDGGPGLGAEQVARLFQPFERLGLETTGIEGTGLGLIISRRLMEGMEGSLSLSSRPGEGSCVRLELPLAELGATPAASSGSDVVPRGEGLAAGATPADTAPHATARANASAQNGRPPAPAALRMLYVEDNHVNAILFEEAIKLRGGFELRVAEDGAESLALVQRWRPDVLVLDANLPGMTGYEVLATLRRQPGLSKTPAFMCSADALPEDLERARRAGFAGYWTKPIDISRVMSDLDALRLAPCA